MNSGEKTRYVRNLAYAGFAGQAGCWSSGVVIGALLLGLWLDAILGTRPIFTIVLMIVSVPVGLFVMVRLILAAVRRITPPPQGYKKIENDEDDV
jgi:F0F1-type ATP synthase assembly protein I